MQRGQYMTARANPTSTPGVSTRIARLLTAAAPRNSLDRWDQCQIGRFSPLDAQAALRFLGRLAFLPSFRSDCTTTALRACSTSRNARPALCCHLALSMRPQQPVRRRGRRRGKGRSSWRLTRRRHDGHGEEHGQQQQPLVDHGPILAARSSRSKAATCGNRSWMNSSSSAITGVGILPDRETWISSPSRRDGLMNGSPGATSRGLRSSLRSGTPHVPRVDATAGPSSPLFLLPRHAPSFGCG
jgi:hypothetical protein